MDRVKRWTAIWHQPKVKMTHEEWKYIAILALGSVTGFNLGLLIGFVWIKLL